MISVNGEKLAGFEGMSVTKLLAARGYNTVYVAVELNGEILKRDLYPETTLKENDELEVVNFVGGG